MGVIGVTVRGVAVAGASQVRCKRSVAYTNRSLKLSQAGGVSFHRGHFCLDCPCQQIVLLLTAAEDTQQACVPFFTRMKSTKPSASVTRGYPHTGHAESDSGAHFQCILRVSRFYNVKLIVMPGRVCVRCQPALGNAAVTSNRLLHASE